MDQRNADIERIPYIIPLISGVFVFLFVTILTSALDIEEGWFFYGAILFIGYGSCVLAEIVHDVIVRKKRRRSS